MHLQNAPGGVGNDDEEHQRADDDQADHVPEALLRLAAVAQPALIAPATGLVLVVHLALAIRSGAVVMAANELVFV